MRVLVIEKAAVKQNIRVVKRRAGGAAVYGVLSGDAGGAGIAEMAELLRAEGIGPLRRQRGGGGRGAAEGRLCGRGDPHAPLHHRPGGAGAAGGPERGVHHLLRGHGPGPQRPAENRSTVAEAHIQVDTGMGFGGFLVGEPEKILLAYRSLPNVALSGIYTQIHAAPAGQEAEHQLQQFQRVLGRHPRRRALRPAPSTPRGPTP